MYTFKWVPPLSKLSPWEAITIFQQCARLCWEHFCSFSLGSAFKAYSIFFWWAPMVANFYPRRVDLIFFFLSSKIGPRMKKTVGDTVGNTVSCQEQRMIIKERSLKTIPREDETRFWALAPLQEQMCSPQMALGDSSCVGAQDLVTSLKTIRNHQIVTTSLCCVHSCHRVLTRL